MRTMYVSKSVAFVITHIKREELLMIHDDVSIRQKTILLLNKLSIEQT